MLTISPKPAIRCTRLKKDRTIILPKEYLNTSKDICELIRKMKNIKDSEDIYMDVFKYCQIDGLKFVLFSDLPKDENISIRLYIR